MVLLGDAGETTSCMSYKNLLSTAESIAQALEEVFLRFGVLDSTHSTPGSLCSSVGIFLSDPSLAPPYILG